MRQKQQLRAQKFILSHEEELLSKAPQAAHYSQKALSKGILTASVLLCDWVVTFISVYSEPAVVISVVALTHAMGSLLFMPCLSDHHHPDWARVTIWPTFHSEDNTGCVLFYFVVLNKSKSEKEVHVSEFHFDMSGHIQGLSR